MRLSDSLDATGEIPAGALDSDSDVKLFGADDLLADNSDSDVKLSPPGSDIRIGSSPGSAPKSLLPPDSDLKLIDRPSSIRAGAGGSGINLVGADSGISLALDSGISLEANDSGISLESYDSRTKGGDDDSGISLDGGDSGISLDLDDDLVPGPADFSRTQPMQAIPGARRSLADSGNTTQLEIPSPVVGKDSEFELAGLDDDDAPGTSTSVLTFEDDDLGDSQTIAAPAFDDSSAEFSDEAPAEEEYADEYEEDGGYGGEEEFEDYDGADEDSDDDGGGFSGTSTVSSPAAVRRAEVDWGIGIKLMIGCSAVLGVVCSVVGIELMRTMWIWTQPGNNAEASPVLTLIGGLF